MNTFNRFAAFSDNGGMSIEKAAPRKPKKTPRFAGYSGVDEEGYIPNMKRENNITDYAAKGNSITDPFAKMLDSQALAYQAQFGGSYEQAYTKIYCDPSNRSIVDAARFEHLAQGEDAICGSRLSPISVAKAAAAKAAPPDAKQDFVSRGAAHQQLHQMALEHSRAHGLSYAQSYTRLFTSPENVALRAGIAAEAGIRTLTLDEARALAPAKEFPDYGNPGDERFSSRHRAVGREGPGGQDF
jgi:hypothetical protein